MQIPGLGRRKIISLQKQIPELFYDSLLLHSYLRDVYGIQDLSGYRFQAEAILNRCRKRGIKILPGKGFGPLCDPPLLLYVKGDVSLLKGDNAAVIGTRTPCSESLKALERVVSDLTEKGMCIVSGLAHGCDSAAHKNALLFGGKTIAVLPSGTEKIYPEENKVLAREIEEKGALVSEYPPYTPVARYRFIERDRLQAGFSRLVILAECLKNGGSMHCIKTAYKEGKPLGVFSGLYGSRSGGEFSGNRLVLEQFQGYALENPRTFNAFLKKRGEAGQKSLF